MKGIVLSFIFLFSGVHLASGQWNIAIRGGGELIPISSNDRTHDRNLPFGAHIGFLGRFPLFENFKLQPEVQFSWLKYKKHTSVPDNNFVSDIAEQYQVSLNQARQMINSYWQESRTMTTYFYFPILLRYEYNEGFAMVFGPSIGLVCKNKNDNRLVATFNGQKIDDHTVDRGLDGIRQANIAMSFGLEWTVSKYSAAEFRYSRSLNALETGHSYINSYYNFVQLSYIYRLFSSE